MYFLLKCRYSQTNLYYLLLLLSINKQLLSILVSIRNLYIAYSVINYIRIPVQIKIYPIIF